MHTSPVARREKGDFFPLPEAEGPRVRETGRAESTVTIYGKINKSRIMQEKHARDLLSASAIHATLELAMQC